MALALEPCVRGEGDAGLRQLMVGSCVGSLIWTPPVAPDAMGGELGAI